MTLRQRFRQVWCGLRYGHHDMLRYEWNRLRLVCGSCQRLTPGWDVAPRRLVVLWRGQKRVAS